MPKHVLSYRETNRFSSLVTDYLEEKEHVWPYYHRFPNFENFKLQITEKADSYQEHSPGGRKLLAEELQEQYTGFKLSERTEKNISLLKKDNTFTITTGHQLNLFTGPLYFLYKIISTMKLASRLQQQFPGFNFVPVYWMATEDHDFDEINYFYLHGKKFQWNPSTPKAGGAVGERSTAGLEDVFDLFSAEIGNSQNAQQLKEWFQKAYLEHRTLSGATRYLANELFGEDGLVILDANSFRLKRQFIPLMKEELVEQIIHRNVQPVAKQMDQQGYTVQVNPREINLFYMVDGLRERIIERDGSFFVHDQNISWSREELLNLLEHHPERFSPNVLMRPMYQEVILPNIAYLGGGGELAYWLELKKTFESVNLPFPILLLRNSVLIQKQKQKEKMKKLGISEAEIFLKEHELINRKVRQISNIEIDFAPQKEHLSRQFQQLYELADKTDKSFLGAVRAQETKQLKGLEKLEKRLLRAQKKKLSDEVSRITAIQKELFPNQGLQERHHNFSEYYLEYGPDLMAVLDEYLDPLELKFDIISL